MDFPFWRLAVLAKAILPIAWALVRAGLPRSECLVSPGY
jgi:hypothetical protein